MKRKTWIISSAAIIIAIIIIAIFTDEGNSEVSITAKVEKAKFDITVTTTGSLKAENSEKITAPDGLRQNNLYNVQITDLIPEGTLIDSGDYVATLDRTEGTDKLNNLADELQKVEAQYTKAKLDTTLSLRNSRDELINMKYTLEERKIELDQSKYETPATIRQAKINLEKAERAYSQAQKNYEIKEEQANANMLEISASLSKINRRINNLQTLLDQFVINAPKSGMLIYYKEWGGAKRKVGSKISPWNPVVATLPDLSTMISKTYVNEIDISKVKNDQNVELRVDAFPERKYTGKVIEVANIGEQLQNSESKVFEVIIRVNESDTFLRPAMTTSNTILTNSYEDVLFVPLESIVATDTLSFVFKKKGGNIVKQIVDLGESNENHIIIKTGLDEEDEVYLSTPAETENLNFAGLDIYEMIKEKKLKEEEERKLRQDSIRKNKKKNDKKEFHFNMKNIKIN